jgi:hypothetical protein
MKLKETIRQALLQKNFEGLADMALEHGGKITNGLMAFLAEMDEQKKWPAVKALGVVTARLYELDPERAKKVLRQLIWNLNEESGGIGWGIPEAFGEILAMVPALQKEYACLLVAYIAEGPCFIENETLQKGVLWGLGRLRQIEERLKNEALPFLIKSLKNGDSSLQATAVWALGEIGGIEAVPFFKSLQRENEMIKLFIDKDFQEKPISQWVKESLDKLNQGGE